MPLGPLATNVRVVRVNARYLDPALDAVEMNLEAYRTTRDPALVKCREGMKPAWFVIRRLKAAFMLETLDSFEGNQRLSLAARAGLVAVETAEGVRLEPASVTSGAYETPIADAAWLDTITQRFGLDTVREMGRLVVELSTLGEGVRGPLFSSAG